MTQHKRKTFILTLLACNLAAITTGCGNSMETQEQIVTPKDTTVSDQTSTQSQAADTTASNNIIDQVQAPSHYTFAISEGNITIEADADFVIPDAEGFKSYKVTPRLFTQEDYNTISQVLLDGAALWSRDYDAMEQSNGFTKSEIEDHISELQAKQASSDLKMENNKPSDYDAHIAEFQDLLKYAPEEPIIIDIPAIVPDSGTTGSGSDGKEMNLFANATFQGEDYDIWVDNNLLPQWGAATFGIDVNSERSIGAGNNYVDTTTIDSTLSVEAITQNAQQVITEMGYTDFTPTSGEYYQALSFNELDGELIYGAIGYGIPFERTVDGIPITYTHEQGLTLNDDEQLCWPYESFVLVFDDKGFTDFEWISPYSIEKVSDDTVFLLPFSDIQNVFEEMMLKVATEEYTETDINATYQINEIRLGYMRVREKGTISEGSLIPVWDFFGTEILQFPDDEYTYSTEGLSYESQFTINAMDGTVIDRGLGY